MSVLNASGQQLALLLALAAPHFEDVSEVGAQPVQHVEAHREDVVVRDMQRLLQRAVYHPLPA